MKVFVSSVVDGYEHFRDAVCRAIKARDHDPVLMGQTNPALPHTPRKACLDGVAASDVVVLLLGSRYGSVHSANEVAMSATHEEWGHARDLGKDVLVFVEGISDWEPDQEAFLTEVGDYLEGRFYKQFSTESQLFDEVIDALRHLEDRRAQLLDFSKRLPVGCSRLIDELRESVPDAAHQLLRLLSDSTAGRGRSLAQAAEDPPAWAVSAGSLIWDAMCEFMGAHNMAGLGQVRMRAVEAGSVFSRVYLAREAISRVSAGDADTAEELLGRLSDDDPMADAARARISDDPAGVVTSVTAALLHESDDPAVAELAVMLLATAYQQMDQTERAVETLRSANQRLADNACGADPVWLTP